MPGCQQSYRTIPPLTGALLPRRGICLTDLGNGSQLSQIHVELSQISVNQLSVVTNICGNPHIFQKIYVKMDITNKSVELLTSVTKICGTDHNHKNLNHSYPAWFPETRWGPHCSIQSLRNTWRSEVFLGLQPGSLGTALDSKICCQGPLSQTWTSGPL